MTELHYRAKELFLEARALPEAQRPAWLEQACDGDAALREEVESLLAAAEGMPDSYLAPFAEIGLAPGSTLAHYRIRERLGAGGMGEVYGARDSDLDRDVAIKVLPRRLAEDPDRLARLRREAKVLASLNHQNIAAIHGLVEDAGVRGIVLELVEGPTLAERLQRGPVPLDEALAVARQICDGLEAAHEKGVVHRDLKPANIKLRPDGTVKVLDFGLAKAITEDAEGAGGSRTLTATAEWTRAGLILGTPGYMSPEQARGQPVDRRTDIWAFGCVLYELLSGRAAFSGESTPDTLAAVLGRDPEWSALPTATPVAVRRLLGRCLEKDLKRRLRDIGDARLEIDDALDGTRVGPSADGGRAALLSRRQIIAGSVALGAAGVGGGLGIGALARPRSRSAGTPSYQRLTFRRGMIRTARFAPDGQTVLYGALWDGDVCRVYSVRPESPESAPVSLPPAAPLAVSSSGELALALGTHFRGTMTYGTLARVPLAGGAPREMLEGVKYADWSPVGDELAVVRHIDGREQLEFPVGNVVAEPAAGGGGFSFPRISPRGDRVAFFELTSAGDLTGSVATVDRSGGKSIRSQRYFNVFGLAWRGDEIWFTAADDRPLLRNAIHAIGPDNTPRVVARIPGNVSLHDISQDGRVLMARTDDRAGIAVLALGETLERDLAWLDAPFFADISRDGSAVLFTEWGVGGGPGNSVYIRSTTGSPAVRLSSGRALALSPDGQWAIVGESELPGEPWSHLAVIPTGPGRARRIEHPGLTYREARWLPDGERVVVRAREGGRSPRLYALELSDGSIHAITPEGVADGGWALSPDGTTVAVAAEGEAELYPVSGGKAPARPGLTIDGRLLAWIEGGLLVSDDPSFLALHRVSQIDLASGRREIWREIQPRDPAGIMNVWGLAVTPDGRSYGYSWHRALSDLYLVEGLS